MGKWLTAKTMSSGSRIYFLASVRAISMTLAIAMVGFGLWVILNDRPSGRLPGKDPVSLSEQCSGNARIEVSPYNIKIDLTPSGYFMYGGVTLLRTPAGSGQCQLAAQIPNDATRIGGNDFRIERTSAPARLQAAVASVSRAGGPVPLEDIGLQYFSPDIQREGWGEVSFMLPAELAQDGQQGELVSATGSTIFGGQASTLHEDVDISCPRGSTISSSYPSGARQIDPGETAWTKLLPGMFIEVSCQNPQVRFWVGHATDLIVLGVGAILGLLVALDPRRRPGTPHEPPPGPGTRPPGPTPRTRRSRIAFTLGLIFLLIITGQRRRLPLPAARSSA